MTDLITRCAAHGWTLRQDGDGYELTGNGAPAAFRSEENLRAWLEKQREPFIKVRERGIIEHEGRLYENHRRSILGKGSEVQLLLDLDSIETE